MMNEKQITIVAEYLRMSIDQVKACNDVVENGLTKYAAEKKYKLSDNTIGRKVIRFEKLLTMLKAMGEAHIQ